MRITSAPMCVCGGQLQQVSHNAGHVAVSAVVVGLMIWPYYHGMELNYSKKIRFVCWMPYDRVSLSTLGVLLGSAA